MTTQPSIESLRDLDLLLAAINAHGAEWPVGWTPSSAYARIRGELQSLRASEAALRAENERLLLVEEDRDVLNTKLGVAVRLESSYRDKLKRALGLVDDACILNAIDSLTAERDALRAERDALKADVCRADAETGRWRNNATAAEARAEKAELSAHNAEVLCQAAEAGEEEATARADALGARVEALEELFRPLARPPLEGPDYHGHTAMCRQCNYKWGLDDDAKAGYGALEEHGETCAYIVAKKALSSTPAVDLSAHDARVRREALEEAWERVRVAPYNGKPSPRLWIYRAILGPEARDNGQETK